jgi:predicted O-methyltransferase YrrM
MLQLSHANVAPEAQSSVQLFREFLTCRVVHALDNLGFFDAVGPRDNFRITALSDTLGVPVEHLRAVFDYLEDARLFQKSDNGYTFQPGARDALTEGLGFIQWLIGAYGPLLDGLEDLLRGRTVYGRDVQRRDNEVARSSTTIGRTYTDPFLREMLQIEGVRTIADIGTGSALRLIDICLCFPALRAVGIDISPACCEVARQNVARAGLQDRISIVEARAEDWLKMAQCRQLERIDLVLCCAMFHDLLNHAGSAEAFLADVMKGLHPGAYLLIQDQMTLPERRPRREHWVAGFELVHHLMGQRLFPRQTYEAVFASVGLELVQRRETPIPENWIYLLRIPDGARKDGASSAS